MRQLSIIEFSAGLVASSVEEFTLGELHLPLSSFFEGAFVDTDLLIVFPLTFYCVSFCIYVDALAFSIVFDETSNVGVAIRILRGALSVLLVVFPFTLVDCTIRPLVSPLPVLLSVSVFSLVDLSIRPLVHAVPVYFIIFNLSLVDIAMRPYYSS